MPDAFNYGIKNAQLILKNGDFMKAFLLFILAAFAGFTTFAQTSATITVNGDQIQEAPAAPATASEELTLDAIQDEMDAAVPPQQVVTRVKRKDVQKNNMYIMGVAGTSSYPEVSNVNGSFAVSGALGYFWDSFMLEAGVGMANYTMDVRNFSTFSARDNYDVEQYSFQLGAKYRIMEGSFVPNVGMLAAYANRSFTLSNPATTAFSLNSTLKGESQTMDAGLSAGVDYEFAKDYAIGLDFKYMFNVSNSATNTTNTNASITTTGYSGTPIEALQYYTAGVSGRMNF